MNTNAFKKYKQDNGAPPNWKGYGNTKRCGLCYGCTFSHKCVGDKTITTKPEYDQAYSKMHADFAKDTINYWREVVKKTGGKPDLELIVIPEEIRITEENAKKGASSVHKMHTRNSKPPPEQRPSRSRARSPISSSSSPSPSPSPSSLPRPRSPSPIPRTSSSCSLPSSPGSQKSAGNSNFDTVDSLRNQLLTANDMLELTRRQLDAEKRENELDRRERDVEKREIVEERRKIEEERKKFEEEKKVGEEERANLKRRIDQLEKESEELRACLRQEGHPQFLQELNLL